jgi:murein DD-endopeptidase MepM/ murein hydrolase activator NlpD
MNAGHRPAVSITGRAEVRREGELPSTQDLELALLRFTSKRRQLFSEEAPAHTPESQGADSGRWPRPIESAFTSVLDQLEVGFARPLGSIPRRVLIQARVTMEVELDLAQSKYGPAPKAMVDRVTHLFAVIATHMRASPTLREERPRLARELDLTWPVSPVIVTSPFGYRRDPILGRSSVRFHAGVDLGGSSGDVVHAAGAGRVISAGWLGGHGRTVIVQHPGGYQTVYAHMRQILIPTGAEVDPGSPLGFVGSSGRSTGPHLHFEVRHGGVPLDPLDLVESASGNRTVHASR